MSCITASVHNPSHLTSLSAHTDYLTLSDQLAGEERGRGDEEAFVQGDLKVQKRDVND